VCALIPLDPPFVDTVAVVKYVVRINEMRLLIVEDNGQMREMIKFFLRDVAEEIAERGDGSEALAAYREFAPDWVVMDIGMGKLDGIEATRQIISAFPRARIVMLTQYDDLALRQAASEAGAQGYFTKGNLLPLREMLERESGQTRPLSGRNNVD
jgi:CheY-like chemotaxis protein